MSNKCLLEVEWRNISWSVLHGLHRFRYTRSRSGSLSYKITTSFFCIFIRKYNSQYKKTGGIYMKCLTPSEVKEILGVKQSIAYELFNSKDFPSFKVKGCWRVTDSDLNDWIEKQKKLKLSNY